jgi:hypothetical protein
MPAGCRRYSKLVAGLVSCTPSLGSLLERRELISSALCNYESDVVVLFARAKATNFVNDRRQQSL